MLFLVTFPNQYHECYWNILKLTIRYIKIFPFYLLIWGFGPHPAMFRVYSRLFTNYLFVEVLRGPEEVPEMEPELDLGYEASTLQLYYSSSLMQFFTVRLLFQPMFSFEYITCLSLWSFACLFSLEKLQFFLEHTLLLFSPLISF